MTTGNFAQSNGRQMYEMTDPGPGLFRTVPVKHLIPLGDDYGLFGYMRTGVQDLALVNEGAQDRLRMVKPGISFRLNPFDDKYLLADTSEASMEFIVPNLTFATEENPDSASQGYALVHLRYGFDLSAQQRALILNGDMQARKEVEGMIVYNANKFFIDQEGHSTGIDSLASQLTNRIDSAARHLTLKEALEGRLEERVKEELERNRNAAATHRETLKTAYREAGKLEDREGYGSLISLLFIAGGAFAGGAACNYVNEWLVENYSVSKWAFAGAVAGFASSFWVNRQLRAMQLEKSSALEARLEKLRTEQNALAAYEPIEPFGISISTLVIQAEEYEQARSARLARTIGTQQATQEAEQQIIRAQGERDASQARAEGIKAIADAKAYGTQAEVNALIKGGMPEDQVADYLARKGQAEAMGKLAEHQGPMIMGGMGGMGMGMGGGFFPGYFGPGAQGQGSPQPHQHRPHRRRPRHPKQGQQQDSNGDSGAGSNSGGPASP